jgi:hypothetical protein
MSRTKLVVRRVKRATRLLRVLADIVAALAEPDGLDWCEILLAKPILVRTQMVRLCRDPGRDCAECGACSAQSRPRAGQWQ